MKGFFVTLLAAVGAYAIWEWYSKNPRSHGGPNPVAQEVTGVTTGVAEPFGQLSSGIPIYNAAPIANGHGDQVSAALPSNRYSHKNGRSNYVPAFGPQEMQSMD